MPRLAAVSVRAPTPRGLLLAHANRAHGLA